MRKKDLDHYLFIFKKFFKKPSCTCLHFAKYTGTQSHIKQLLSSLSFGKPGREAGPPRAIPQGIKCFIGKRVEDASQAGRQGPKSKKKTVKLKRDTRETVQKTEKQF